MPENVADEFPVVAVRKLQAIIVTFPVALLLRVPLLGGNFVGNGGQKAEYCCVFGLTSENTVAAFKVIDTFLPVNLFRGAVRQDKPVDSGQ